MNYLSNNLVAEAQQHIEVINAEKVELMRQQGINIIDVREPNEYSEGAILGAINIPRSILEFDLGRKIKEEDRNKPHVIYCKTGGRAALAALTMKNMGYSQVQAMQTGFVHWEEEGRKIQNNPII
ncbi:MAG: rhodanese-like domain-containing protein [Cocleimonas sp.]|nr:rhodanese-like domain-containing protein [Cocleimonas sp.]